MAAIQVSGLGREHVTHSMCEEEAFPTDQVVEECQQWMSKFLADFKPFETKRCTFKKLYSRDVSHSPEENEAMREVYKAVWGEREIPFWSTEKLPQGWIKHSSSSCSCNFENPNFPGFIFKFCFDLPGKATPAAHFLRVAKGKEIKGIVEREALDELEVVEEQLIALKSLEVIKKMSERDQCFEFVVKSKKINLLNESEEATISELASYPLQRQIKIASQIMQMICMCGLGDVSFDNLKINRETGKLVILDTEPLYGSLSLDEEPSFYGQYSRTNELKEVSHNARSVRIGLGKMVEACELPIFRKVAHIYIETFDRLLSQSGL